MSRQLEAKVEQRQQKRDQAVIRALEFELVGSIESLGLEFLGFAIKYDAWECLMTLKVRAGGEKRVCFVGADSLTACVLKAVGMAQSDRLRWKVDVW